jgi:hypothetical protein
VEGGILYENTSQAVIVGLVSAVVFAGKNKKAGQNK